MKPIHFLLISAFLGFLACSGNSSNNNAQQNRAGGGPGSFQRVTSVETIPVAEASISKQIKSYGTIQPQFTVTVVPQVSNRIVKLYADLGDTVQQDQLLAKIYDVPFRDAVEGSRAQIRQAKAAIERDSLQFARQRELFVRNLISTADFESSRTIYLNSIGQYESAKANLTQSLENLRNSEIRSPVYGVVTRRNISVGDLASQGQPAYEINNLIGYETRLYLPLHDWQLVKIGQNVSFRLSNDKNESAIGRVSRISPQLDPLTGLGEVVVSLTKVSGPIFPGVLTEAAINILTKTGSVVIPRSALVENVQTLLNPESNTIQLTRTYAAFVSQGDSVAIRRSLTLGIEQGDKIEVLEGLKLGDKLIITGQGSLDNNGRIRVAGSQQFRPPQQRSLSDTTKTPVANATPQQRPAQQRN